MGVEQIKAFSIIGNMRSLDRVSVTLGRSKVFQPDEVKNFYSDTGGFKKVSASGTCSEALSRFREAMKELDIAPEFVRTKKTFNPSIEEIEDYSERLLAKVEKYSKKRAELRLEYNECRRALEETSHFVGLDRNIEELLSMKYVKAVFGRILKDNVKKLETENYKNDFIEFVPCSTEGAYIWGVYFAPINEFEKAERLFSRLYFEKSTFGSMDSDPEKQHKLLSADIQKLSESLEKLDEKLETYAEEKRKKILAYYTKASELDLYLSIRTHALERNGNFCLTGWVPETKADKLREKLEKIESVEVSVSSGDDERELSPPVKLKNVFLARPFEFYTEMYGVPKYNEIDPTAFIAFTYVLLFGIMFGDVGHGIIVAIVGLLMWFIKRMPIGKILITCGISGAVFGVVYGSAFGFENAMDWFYKGIIRMPHKPIEVMSPEFTSTILFLAVGIGMCLLCVAMGLNIYSSLRQRNPGRALFDTGGLAGLIFYGMLCAGLGGMMIFGVNLFSPVYIAVIVLMFVLIFFREPLGKLVNREADWKPENIGSFIAENIFEALEVLLSYVTNTMSFLRVAAFVLVHAGMMQVVFTLSDTAGAIGYVPIMIIGNLLVCALEALLVSIQVLRLEYYEMFSRFYSGEGRPYEPVKLKLVK